MIGPGRGGQGSALFLKKASVVIPVLDAEPWLATLLGALASQAPEPPFEAILIDSNSRDRTREIGLAHGAQVIPIERFTHGRARNLGARAARGEFVVFLTQDAEPADRHWLARLLEPFEDPAVAAAYSRQVPRPDAEAVERFNVARQFPDGPIIRRAWRAGEPMTPQKAFFSNVSSAVRRDLLLRHPFDETLIMGEDQQLARDLLQAGFATVYMPRSVVIHSHNYPLGAWFRRYFDTAHALTLIYAGHSIGASAAMGLRIMGRESLWVLRRAPLSVPRYVLFLLCRTAAVILGHHAARLPRALVRRLSMHPYHWESG